MITFQVRAQQRTIASSAPSDTVRRSYPPAQLRMPRGGRVDERPPSRTSESPLNYGDSPRSTELDDHIIDEILNLEEEQAAREYAQRVRIVL